MGRSSANKGLATQRIGSPGTGAPLPSSERLTQWLFVGPAVLVLFLTSVYPLLYSLWISFFHWRMSRPGARPVFAGLENYINLLSDEVFLQSVRNSLIYSFSTVAVQTVLGLGIALLLTRELKIVRAARAIVLIPMLLTPVVVGLLWKIMFNYTFGLVNYFLNMVGLPGQMWLSEPNTALLAAILVDIWQWTPMMVLVMLAGLQSLPREPSEAALVDGANAWQIFRFITLPLLMPVVSVIVLIRFMDSFKVFDTVWTLTMGGPGYATELITLFIYRTGFKFFNVGYAAAASWMLLLFVMAGSVFFIRRLWAGMHGH